MSSNPSTALIVYQQFDVLQSSATKYDNGPKLAQTIAPCKKQKWKFRVQVVSLVNKWPKHVWVKVDFDDGDGDYAEMPMTKETSAEHSVEGEGPNQAVTTVDVEGWTIAEIENKNLTLPGGDGVLVKVKIKPKPWIKIDVINKLTGKSEPNIGLKLKLPGMGDHEPSTTDATLEIPNLDPGTADLLTLTHAAIWECVDYKEE